MLDSAARPSSKEELLWRAVGGFDREGCGRAAMRSLPGSAVGAAGPALPVGPGVKAVRTDVNFLPDASAAEQEAAPGVFNAYFEKQARLAA